jgi:hypothetical protein
MTDFTDDDTAVWEQSDWTPTSGSQRPRRVARTRTHHVVQRSSPLPPLERGAQSGFWTDETWPDRDRDAVGVDNWAALEPARAPALRRRRARPTSGSVGVDPRLLRLGVVAIAMVLMIPVALALREDRGGDEVRSQEPAAFASPGASASDRAAEPLTRAKRRALRAASRTPTAAGDASASAAPEDEAATSAELVAVPARAEPEPACAGEYSVVSGDYWVRFAESTDADLGAWLRANDASVDTPLYAGDVLCIPEGASAPAPPATAAPTTTEAPETTEPPPTTEASATADPRTTTDAPPETPAPTTTATLEPTAPPATTPDPPVSRSGAEAIIRDVWPDDLEEQAVVIAQRESNLRADAYNGWCCYGLFQIYFDANRSFLASLGVTTAEQLLNARTNAMVAYAMYQRSGWSPWASTNY